MYFHDCFKLFNHAIMNAPSSTKRNVQQKLNKIMNVGYIVSGDIGNDEENVVSRQVIFLSHTQKTLMVISS